MYRWSTLGSTWTVLLNTWWTLLICVEYFTMYLSPLIGPFGLTGADHDTLTVMGVLTVALTFVGEEGTEWKEEKVIIHHKIRNLLSDSPHVNQTVLRL
jgi:hypothetical protein